MQSRIRKSACMSGRSDSDYGLAIVELLLGTYARNEGIGWLSGWAQYVPFFVFFLPKSIPRLMGLCILCDVEEHKLRNERKRHRVPRLSASVRVLCIRTKGWIGESESTEQRENAGDFPGVDHPPEDSRLPHSVTRGAWRITILRAKGTTACQSFSLSHNVLSITIHSGYTSCST